MMLKQRVGDTTIANLVTHMLTQEFGDRGSWGCNQTEAPYLIASLNLADQKAFIDLYLERLRENLVKSFNDSSLSATKAKQALADFQRFNPTFGGGFHMVDTMER